MASEMFELRRFGWATPDRLEVAGRFSGLGGETTGDPVLMLRGGDSTHRLFAVRGEAAGETTDDEEWRAVFAWQETPAPFEVAQLELGEELLVDLPTPIGDDADERDPELLDVRRRGAHDRLRARVELLAADSRLAEAHARLARLDDELARARADLAAERAGRADDAEVYRARLTAIEQEAEEAVSEARADAGAMRARLEELTAAGAEAARLRERMVSIFDLAADSVSSDRPPGGAAPSAS
jgi:hypothetical protein